jgi:ribosomal protein S18 acetylase RimI-like enzyme
MAESEMHISRATVADAQELSHLSVAVFPLGCPANTKPEDLAEYINRELTAERFRMLLEDDRFLILVLKTSHRLAGYALVARGEVHPKVASAVQCELRKFYVDAAYHGRGVANALMEEVLAATSGASLWLSVFSGNERAISFYKRWGFQMFGSQYFLVGTDRQKDSLMQREASATSKEDPQCK